MSASATNAKVAMPRPFVSVALCTFDGAQYVHEQLQSLLAQSVLPDEIVVSDDASRDTTRAIVESTAGRWSGRLTLVRQEINLGAVRNFESALARTTGEIVFLCDQDDVWSADKIARAVREFDRHPDAQLVHSDARLIDASGRSLGRTLLEALAPTRYERNLIEQDRSLEVLLRRNFVTGATTALRRSLFELARPFPQEFLHDEWLALIAAAVGAIRRVEEPLIDYRIHAGNQAGLRGVLLASRLRAMTSGRGDYHVNRARKLDVLFERLSHLGGRVPADRLRIVEACREHWHRRADLPKAPLARLGSIMREWQSGRYRRFSSGPRSALRDLCEPLP
jgi:glycosyltransferase involved in cell wall biosynthesis